MENNILPACKTHPDAPHGFLRNASHSEGRYVCECEYWEEPKEDVDPLAVYNDERLVSNFDKKQMAEEQQSLVFRLEERARIRRQISTRKSVQEGAPDRIADLLEEAAKEITRLKTLLNKLYDSKDETNIL